MKRTRAWLIPLAVIVVLTAAFLIYTGEYYHAGDTAKAMLESDGAVKVSRTDYGWRFDGPSETDALVFYPGAKVEETAYAPLLRTLAEEGMDVCLVKMPFRLAIFGLNKADRVMAEHDYGRWYIGGHSLGGAMAASYAAGHASKLAGVALLAAYATKPLDDNLAVVTIYGSEDSVLNRDKLAKGEGYLPEGHRTQVIEGGNHAQFGDYGEQRGDGTATIPAEAQWERTVELILEGMTL